MRLKRARFRWWWWRGGRLRELGAMIALTPRPPGAGYPGERPEEFAARLIEALDR